MRHLRIIFWFSHATAISMFPLPLLFETVIVERGFWGVCSKFGGVDRFRPTQCSVTMFRDVVGRVVQSLVQWSIEGSTSFHSDVEGYVQSLEEAAQCSRTLANFGAVWGNTMFRIVDTFDFTLPTFMSIKSERLLSIFKDSDHNQITSVWCPLDSQTTLLTTARSFQNEPDFFWNEPFEKWPVMTIEDSDFHFNGHFESNLWGNGLYVKLW